MTEDANAGQSPGPELAILLEPYGCVYVEIPKVACTSIKVAIAELLEIELEGPGGDPHQSTYPTISGDRSAERLFPGLFSFAFVRNPWDRLVSCYRDKICGEVEGFTHSTIRPGIADCLARFEAFEPNMPFDRFVDAVTSIADDEADAHFRSQHTFIANSAGTVAVDYVGRYESLGADLVRIQKATGMPCFQLPRLQSASRGPVYHEYYGDRTRELVGVRYAHDIEYFAYGF